jgi:hypothetical protein
VSKKNTWFKHYNNSFDGQSLELLLSENDYEAITAYWWILEQISKFEDPKQRGKCRLSYAILKRKLGWNRSRSVRVLSKIGLRTSLEFTLESGEDYFEVFHPKWLKLQENSKKNGVKSEDQNTEKNDPLDIRVKNRELRDKKKEEKVTDFFEILNSTCFNNELLTKQAEIEAVEKFLVHEKAFGEFIPPVFGKKLKPKFLATIVHVYENTESFRSDLNAIINEKFTDEKSGAAKSDYIATRIKNKTLELFNAAR